MRWSGMVAVGLALGSLACVAMPVQAEEAYFLLLFGAQREPNQPRYAHTFATFVKTTGPGRCPADCHLEVHTISWLPASMAIRPFAIRAERGRNVPLGETIRWALANEDRVSMWGPYRIRPELYYRAVSQCSLLASGRVCYKAIDSFHSTDRVSNCIHAVSSIVEGYRIRALSPAWGETASWYVLRRMQPYIVDVCQVYPSVATDLGLDAYPLVHRCFENPRSSAGWRTLKAICGAR